MATVVTLSHKAQNPLTENGHRVMAMVTTTHTLRNIITQGPESLKNKKWCPVTQPTLLSM
jgi:hypothetical protein